MIWDRNFPQAIAIITSPKPFAELELRQWFTRSHLWPKLLNYAYYSPQSQFFLHLNLKLTSVYLRWAAMLRFPLPNMAMLIKSFPSFQHHFLLFSLGPVARHNTLALLKWDLWPRTPGAYIYLKFLAGHQWLTPVILAAQEAEIRRISVQSQPW
jgi:hypothetical protein